MLEAKLKQLYPQGSMGGECVQWLHKIADFPSVGDWVWQKKAFVSQNGDCITFANLHNDYRVGDMVFTTEGTSMGFGYGHGALIIGLTPTNLILAESNFKKDKKVRYGRILSRKDSKIIGIGRFPLRFEFPRPTFRITVLFNDKWSTGVIEDTQKLLKTMGIDVNFYPTMKCGFKNWWYEVSPGQFGNDTFKVLAKSYFDEYVSPLAFPGSHFGVFIIPNREWEGEVFNKPYKEVGWYYPKTNPGKAMIACDENDESFSYDLPLFSHALIHEFFHYLYYVNGKNDNLHDLENEKNLSKAPLDWNWTRIILNI